MSYYNYNNTYDLTDINNPIQNNENQNMLIDEYNKNKKPYNMTKCIYCITHIIISFFAIYLSWKCNDGFNLLSFMTAFICPYLYIIWALATRGGCGLFESKCKLEPLIIS